ncbi:ankyrin repeat protein [Apiospora hydei]|uniref:Ankyrin repeat protein n=1 Tax=Apiospora hydei TaxID=1337664 RepID=A0ABR1XDS6_9PEZI
MAADKYHIANWLRTSGPNTKPVFHLPRVPYLEPGNVEWIFQDDRFYQWKATNVSQLLWIHGAPGTGKTMLCSRIISHIERHCRLSVDAPKPMRRVDFYFDSSDRQKQSLRALLESVAVNMVYKNDGKPPSRCVISFERLSWRQYIYEPSLKHSTVVSETAASLYKSKDHGRIIPSLEELFEVIAAEVSHTEVTYLIIDALNECPEPERKAFFDQFLQRMLQANIKILITSRKIRDIERAIEAVDSNDIRIHDSIVDAETKDEIAIRISQYNDIASRDPYTMADAVDGIVAGGVKNT